MFPLQVIGHLYRLKGAGVASRARASAWSRITPVIIQSNVLLATMPRARPTTLFTPLSEDDDCPDRGMRDDDFFFSIDLPKHPFSHTLLFKSPR
jgi:hypothetical protein